MNKKFRNAIIRTGRFMWKLENVVAIQEAIYLLSLVFIDDRNWGYVNNIYPVLQSFKEE